MRVLVFEPQFVGHNLHYVKHLVRRLLSLGCEVHLVTSTQATKSVEYSDHLGGIQGNFHCHPLSCFVQRGNGGPLCVNGPSANIAVMRGLYSGIGKIKPDHIFIPFGNPLANMAGIPSPLSFRLNASGVETELVLLFGKYAYEPRGFAQHLRQKFSLAILANGPWVRIHHIVPYAVRKMRAFGCGLKDKANLLPDPVEAPPQLSRDQARRILNLPRAGRILALIGLVDRRKGVFELLEAFSRSLPKLLPDDRLLLAGKATDEVRSVLNSKYAELVRTGKIVSIDRHLSSEELWSGCIGANVIATPYPTHRYSASIVIRAAAAGVPVLANSIGWMEEVVQRFSLGSTCDTNDMESFSNALVHSLTHCDTYQATSETERFVHFHRAENFAGHITRRIEQRLGLPAMNKLVFWDDPQLGISEQNSVWAA